jgi:type II secretory pathway pseudopilin PulG
LLVVISIMVIMMGLAATLMRPDLEGRRAREAARALNVYISSARNRAMETGRPCGLILHRFSAGVPAALSMDQCETPPTFAGLSTGAVVQVIDATFNGGAYYWPDHSTILKVRVRYSPSDFGPNLVHPGDLVQLNGEGPYYTILQKDSNSGLALSSQYTDYPLCAAGGSSDPTSFDFSGGTEDSANSTWVGNHWLTLRLDPSYLQQTPWPKAGSSWPQTEQPLTFSVLRQPAKGAEAPLQLPAGAVVDLVWSGCNAPGLPPSLSPALSGGATAGDATILFGPTGSITSVSIANDPNSPYQPTQPIYLLIGKREKIGANVMAGNTNPATMTNWQDLQNVWVSINQQSGFVSTRAITAVSTNNSDPDYVAPSSTPNDPTYMAAALAVSRASKHLTANDQALGGR